MKRLLVLVFSSAVPLGLFVVPAAAGGWAVTTLDEVESPRAGEVTLVGFTIRQHGVTPVDVDGDVGIESTSPSGGVQFIPAVQDGLTGHYVARVVFPEPGDFSWAVRQGQFGEQDLGTVSVDPAGDASDVASSDRWPTVSRFGLPVLAMAAAAFATAGVVRGRRRRRLAAA